MAIFLLFLVKKAICDKKLPKKLKTNSQQKALLQNRSNSEQSSYFN